MLISLTFLKMLFEKKRTLERKNVKQVFGENKLFSKISQFVYLLGRFVKIFRLGT